MQDNLDESEEQNFNGGIRNNNHNQRNKKGGTKFYYKIPSVTVTCTIGSYSLDKNEETLNILI